MRTSDVASGRFAEDQIIGVLPDHETGVKTAELCRKHGISDATFDNRKAKYDGMIGTVFDSELDPEGAYAAGIVH